MKKQLIIYGLGSLALFVITVLVVSMTSGSNEKHETAKNVTTTSVSTTTIVRQTTPPPTFEQTPVTDKIPNPCDSVSKDNVLKYLPNYNQRGPIFQDSNNTPSKLCEWLTPNKEYPRLSVSIFLSKTYFNTPADKIVTDIQLGEKAYIVDGFVNGVGGTSCGKTIIVKQNEFSFSVALCKTDNELPNDVQLVELATGVLNSLGA